MIFPETVHYISISESGEEVPVPFLKPAENEYQEVDNMDESREQSHTKTMSGRITTVVGAILCVVLGAMLLCNLTLIIKGALFPEKPPSVLGITPMVVLSGSMSGEQEGHIEVGDLIFVGRAEPEELAVGDVIAYMSGQTTVTHRITAIDSSGDSLLFTTKGDANDTQDTEQVTEDQLVGRFLWRLPKVGDFALFLQQPLGMLLFAGIPLMAFILYDILRRQRYANRQSRRAAELEAELERLRATSGVSPEEPEAEEQRQEDLVYQCTDGGHTPDGAGI